MKNKKWVSFLVLLVFATCWLSGFQLQAQVSCEDLIKHRWEVGEIWNQRKVKVDLNQQLIKDFEEVKATLLDDNSYTTSGLVVVPMALKTLTDWLNGVLSLTHPTATVINFQGQAIRQQVLEQTRDVLMNSSGVVVDNSLEVYSNKLLELAPVVNIIKDIRDNIQNFQDYDELKRQVKVQVEAIDKKIVQYREQLIVKGQAFTEVDEYLDQINRYLADACGQNVETVIERYLKQVYGPQNYSAIRNDLKNQLNQNALFDLDGQMPEAYEALSVGNFGVITNELKAAHPQTFEAYLHNLGTGLSGIAESGKDVLSRSIAEVESGLETYRNIEIIDDLAYMEKVSGEFNGKLKRLVDDFSVPDNLLKLTTWGHIESNREELEQDILNEYGKIMSHLARVEQIDFSNLDADQIMYMMAQHGFKWDSELIHEQVVTSFVIPKVGELIGFEVEPKQAQAAYTLLTEGFDLLNDEVADKFADFQDKFIEESLQTIELINDFGNAIDLKGNDLDFIKSSLLRGLESPEDFAKELDRLANSPELVKQYGQQSVDKLVKDASAIKEKIETLNTVNEFKSGLKITKTFLEAFDLVDEELIGDITVGETLDAAIAGLTIYASISTGRYDVAITTALGFFSKPQESAESKMLKAVLKKLNIMDKKLDQINEKLDKLSYKIDSLHYVEMKQLHGINSKLDSMWRNVDKKLSEILEKDLRNCTSILEYEFDYQNMTYDEVMDFFRGDPGFVIHPCVISVNSLLNNNWNDLNEDYPSQITISSTNDAHLYNNIYLPALQYFKARFSNNPAAYYNLLSNDNISVNDGGSYYEWAQIAKSQNFSSQVLEDKLDNQILNPILVSQLADSYLRYDIFLSMREAGTNKFIPLEELIQNPPSNLKPRKKQALTILLKYVDVSLAQQAILSGYHITHFLYGTLDSSQNPQRLGLAFKSLRYNYYLQENFASYWTQHMINTGVENSTRRQLDEYIAFVNGTEEEVFEENVRFKLYSQNIDGKREIRFEIKAQSEGGSNFDPIRFRIQKPMNALKGEMIMRPELLDLKHARNQILERLYELEFTEQTKDNKNIIYSISRR